MTDPDLRDHNDGAASYDEVRALIVKACAQAEMRALSGGKPEGRGTDALLVRCMTS